MRVAVVQNESGYPFVLGIPSEDRQVQIPTGLSLHAASAWENADVHTSGMANYSPYESPPKLADLIARGDVRAEIRHADPADAPDLDARDLVRVLLEAYERTEPIHSSMDSSWTGVAQRFGSGIRPEVLNRIAKGRVPPTDEQAAWLRTVSAVVDELFAETPVAG